MNLQRHDPKKYHELKYLVTKGPIKAQLEYSVHNDSHVVGIAVDDYIGGCHKIFGLEADKEKLNKDNATLTQYKEWAEVQLDADREAFAKMEYGTPGRRPILFKLMKDGALQEFKGYHLGWTVEQQEEFSYTRALVESLKGEAFVIEIERIRFHDWWTEDFKEKAIKDGDIDCTL